MGNLKIFEDMIEDSLLALNTAYVAKVIKCNGNTATVLPLTKSKQYGNAAVEPSVISDIPVIQSSRYKLQTTTIDGKEVLTPTALAAGDIVFCVCADRNITEAKNGRMSTPPIGHHSRSDSVVVGIL